MIRKVYLDYAGTTSLNPRVKRTILSCLDVFGNASSIHAVGRRSKKILEDSRQKVARVLNARPEEIVSTGSGTESNNLAVLGIARAYKKHGKHIVTSKIEHHAVLRACQYLEKNEGFKVTYLDVGSNGIVDPKKVLKAIRPTTILVSIMYANNEIGTIQPIAQIAKALNNYRRNRKESIYQFPFFHTDACQAAGALNLNIRELGVDLMTLNGSKIYGPKGTGCLFVRRGLDLQPQILGGDQERGLRAGTENTALIAGFAQALEIADRGKDKESKRLEMLRDFTISEILKKITNSRLNGDAVSRLPNNINISFDSLDGEMLLLALDQKGIQISTGSACTSTSTEPSHVLRALGLRDDLAKGNIRITLGRQTTKKDVDYVLKILAQAVEKLRRL